MKLNLDNEKLGKKIVELEETINTQNAILSAIPDLMFKLNENGKYLDVWAQNPDELAASKDQLMGKLVSKMLPTEASDQIMMALKIAKAKGHSHGQQIRLNTPKGIQWFELSTSLELNDPVSSQFIMLSRDITKRKNAEIEREKTLSEIKLLQGIIPICSYCHNIRDDKGAWSRLEAYISDHSNAQFSHGICPNCIPKEHLKTDLEKS